MDLNIYSYDCDTNIVSFLKNNQWFFDAFLKDLDECGCATISFKGGKILVDPTTQVSSSTFEKECNRLMDNFLLQFASVPKTFNKDLLLEAKDSNFDIFKSSEYVLIEASADDSIIITGLKETVLQRAHELDALIKQVETLKPLVRHYPCSEDDFRLLDGEEVLAKINQVYGDRLMVQRNAANKAIEFQGVYCDISSAQKEIQEYLKTQQGCTVTVFSCKDHLLKEFFVKHWTLREDTFFAIKWKVLPHGIQLHGRTARVRDACKSLNRAKKEMARRSFTWCFPGLSVYISSSEWENHKAAFENHCHCIAIAEKVNDCEQQHHDFSDFFALDSNDENVISINVTNGDITKDSSDVIINGCDSNFKLNSGTLSKAIFLGAGNGIQTECDENHNLNFTKLRVTRGGKLPCRFVIHIALTTFDELEDRVREALERAQELGATSVAIPALGTGRLGWVVSDVATCFNKAFVELKKKTPICIKTINVVVFHNSALETFQQIIPSDQRDRKFDVLAERRLRIASLHARTAVTSQAVSVTFYSNNEDQLKEAYLTLNRVFQEQLAELRLHANDFRGFSQHELIDVLIAAANNSVELQEQGSSVTLRGHKHSVDTLIGQISIINDDLKSATMLSKFVSWRWSPDNVTFYHFPPRVSSAIEKAYQDGHGCVYVAFFGEDLLINFFKMTYTSTVDDEMGGTGVIKRFEGNLETPSQWSDMQGKSVLKVELSPQSSEFQRVSKLFHSSSPSLTVVKIERIQNSSLYEQYVIKKKDVERHLTSKNPVERELFHGTSESDAEKICTQGFDRGFAGKNATKFGHGVYFALESALSQGFSSKNSSGISVMFLAQVLTGDFCAGSRSLKAPPAKSNSSNNCRLYDSVVNKVSDPSIFVVFKDSSVYPSYLISFK